MNVCMPVNRICMAMVFSLGFLGFKVIWSMGILISIFGLGCFLLGNCWEVVESTLDKVSILLCILPRGRGVWICWFDLRGSWLGGSYLSFPTGVRKMAVGSITICVLERTFCFLMAAMQYRGIPVLCHQACKM